VPGRGRPSTNHRTLQLGSGSFLSRTARCPSAEPNVGAAGVYSSQPRSIASWPSASRGFGRAAQPIEAHRWRRGRARRSRTRELRIDDHRNVAAFARASMLVTGAVTSPAQAQDYPYCLQGRQYGNPRRLQLPQLPRMYGVRVGTRRVLWKKSALRLRPPTAMARAAWLAVMFGETDAHC
jgi:hypothetical protein